MDGKDKSKKSSPSTWKARRQRRMVAKKRKEEKALDEQKSQQKKSIFQGGSMLVDKVFEPLKMMLDSYEARLRQNQTNEECYRAYPNLKLEMKRIEVFQKMIEGTQALLEKQMEKQRSIEDQKKTWVQDRQVPSGPRNLVLPNGAETVSPQKSNKRKKRSNKSQTKDATQLFSDIELKDEPLKIVPNSLANKIEEDWMRKLWDEI